MILSTLREGREIGVIQSSHQFVMPFNHNTSLIVAIILTSTLIYELIGPLVSKFALSKAGEIPLEDEMESENRNYT